eukprot:scaffold9150_cov120-Isochrysis_galbana.AAC.10
MRSAAPLRPCPLLLPHGVRILAEYGPFAGCHGSVHGLSDVYTSLRPALAASLSLRPHLP